MNMFTDSRIKKALSPAEIAELARFFTEAHEDGWRPADHDPEALHHLYHKCSLLTDQDRSLTVTDGTVQLQEGVIPS